MLDFLQNSGGAGAIFFQNVHKNPRITKTIPYWVWEFSRVAIPPGNAVHPPASSSTGVSDGGLSKRDPYYGRRAQPSAMPSRTET